MSITQIKRQDTDRPILLVLAFFNYDILKRSLESMVGSTSYYKNVEDIPYDVYVLENPSPYSDKIGEYLKKLYNEGRIKGHYRSHDNIGGNIFFQAIIKGLIEIPKKYVCISEGDVILDKGSFEETLKLLEKYQKVPLCSIDIHLYNLPVGNFPNINSWIPEAIDFDDHRIGNTGLQFITIRSDFFIEFLQAIINKEVNRGIVFMGNGNFFSDSNLHEFCQKKEKYWLRTKYRKLLHIGWELYWNLNNEYYLYKEQLIKSGKFWSNTDTNIHKIL